MQKRALFPLVLPLLKAGFFLGFKLSCERCCVHECLHKYQTFWTSICICFPDQQNRLRRKELVGLVELESKYLRLTPEVNLQNQKKFRQRE